MNNVNIIFETGMDMLKLSSHVRMHMVAINKRDNRFYELLNDVSFALDQAANSILSKHDTVRYTFPSESLDDPDIILSPIYRETFLNTTIRAIYKSIIKIKTTCHNDSPYLKRYLEKALSNLYEAKVDKSMYYGLYQVVMRLGSTLVEEDKRIIEQLKSVLNIVEQAKTNKEENVKSALDDILKQVKTEK